MVRRLRCWLRLFGSLYRLGHQDRLGASGQGQRRGSSRKNVDESEFGAREDAGVPSLDLNDQGMSSFHLEW